MRNLINFRDYMGRTPLHICAMWSNKVACETLLFLKANPHIEDGAGYRPIDYADPGSVIASLLKQWMQRTSAPELTPFEDEAMRHQRQVEEEKKALAEAFKKKDSRPTTKQSAKEKKDNKEAAQTLLAELPKKVLTMNKSLVKRAESGLAFSLVAADLKQ